MGLASINVQVPHLDLRIRPRQTFYALEDANVVILVGEQQDRFTRVSYRCRKSDPRRLVWFQPHALSQTEDGIENGAHSV
jgi:hypothetical protein